MKRAGSGGYSISVRIFRGGCTQRAERPMIRDSLCCQFSMDEL
jgi:hypothetical protein